AFLPIRRSRAWFLLLPGLIVVGLANSESTVVSVEYHYATHFLPYVFVAALFALAVRARSARVPALLAVALASLVNAVHFSAFQRPGDTDPFPHVSFHWTPEDAARLQTFRRLAARIPDDAAVSAGENEGAQLAHRRTLRDLKLGIDAADYVLYSARSLQWGGREELERVLQDGSYGLVHSAGDFTLLARDYDPSHNAQALRRLR
ncbi:MAG TPA: DUF2079 domain-containing protein, partial [Polyangiaceae bacterium]|nr:DUF2079 domain-containing protein [Polyangiaceae bacterium]